MDSRFFNFKCHPVPVSAGSSLLTENNSTSFGSSKNVVSIKSICTCRFSSMLICANFNFDLNLNYRADDIQCNKEKLDGL